MRKISFSRTIITVLILIGAVFVLQRMQNRPPATHLQELTGGGEAGAVAAEGHFSPAEDIERIDVARMGKAQSSIDIAMYAFTDRYLAQQLRELAERGVKIRIYRDHEQYEEEQRKASKHADDSTSAMLAGEENIQIRVKGRRELMHLKAYVVDGVLLRDGSANWSPSGEKRQDNNAHFTADPSQVEAFRREFEQMWTRADNVVVQ